MPEGGTAIPDKLESLLLVGRCTLEQSQDVVNQRDYRFGLNSVLRKRKKVALMKSYRKTERIRVGPCRALQCRE